MALRKRRLEKILLTQYAWDFLDKEQLRALPFEQEKKYENGIAAGLMENFAENLFKKCCSEIGISYYEVKQIFRNQNKQFFKITREMKGIFASDDKEKGELLEKICRNIIIPKCNRVEMVVNEINRLTPEEKAEVLQLLAGLKIKITVEDI